MFNAAAPNATSKSKRRRDASCGDGLETDWTRLQALVKRQAASARLAKIHLMGLLADQNAHIASTLLNDAVLDITRTQDQLERSQSRLCDLTAARDARKQAFQCVPALFATIIAHVQTAEADFEKLHAQLQTYTEAIQTHTTRDLWIPVVLWCEAQLKRTKSVPHALEGRILELDQMTLERLLQLAHLNESQADFLRADDMANTKLRCERRAIVQRLQTCMLRYDRYLKHITTIQSYHQCLCDVHAVQKQPTNNKIHNAAPVEHAASPLSHT